jgi:small subunit ribosomal protein S6
MFLLDSGKFASNPDEVLQHLVDLLEKAGAEIVAHRPWLDGRLAYEIEGKRRGLHYLVYFMMPGGGVAEVTRSCKLSDQVMRHLIIRHEQTLFDAMVEALNAGGGADDADADSAEAKSSDDDDDDNDDDDDSDD